MFIQLYLARFPLFLRVNKLTTLLIINCLPSSYTPLYYYAIIRVRFLFDIF